MHQKRIKLPILSHPHLHWQSLHRPYQAQTVRLNFDFATDSARIRTVPNHFHLHLQVGVATVVSQKAQPPARQSHDDIRIAVPVEISKVDFRHCVIREWFKAELGGLFLKSGQTKIAPHSDFFANRPQIKPAIVVEIDGHQLAESLASRHRDVLSLSSIKTNANTPGTHDRQVRPQVVIEIACAKSRSSHPTTLLARNQLSATLLFQEQRRSVRPACDHIHDMVAVPILHDDRLHIAQRCGHPGSARDIGERYRL